MRTLVWTTFFLPLFFCFLPAQNTTDYSDYHEAVLSVEELIIEENFREALDQMEELSNSYEFVFLRDYKIATQLAVHIQDFENAFKYLKLGISVGWTIKEIKKNKFMNPLTSRKEWDGVVVDYEVLRSEYNKKIDAVLRGEVREMYKKDQKYAYKYLFKIGQKAKESYGNKKGVPHVREQMAQLKDIMDAKGYPGLKLIGESQWMNTILAHHNSVSKEFVLTDTLYPALRPKLVKAIAKGEMNPYDFAFIEDWKIAVKSDRQNPGYGFLDLPTEEELSETNALRSHINIRSIATRNGLVAIQEKTGMDFYLAGYPWVKGKIIPEE